MSISNYYQLGPNRIFIPRVRYLEIDGFLYPVEYPSGIQGWRVPDPAVPKNAWFWREEDVVFAAAAHPCGPSTFPFYRIQVVRLPSNCELPCLITAEGLPSGKLGVPEFVIR